MGGFVDDCFNILKFIFSWVDDKRVWSLAGIIFGLSLLNSFMDVFVDVIDNPILLLATLPILLLIGIVIFYYSIKVTLYALERKGFGNIEYGVVPFLKYILLMIFVSISTFIPWMDKRLLALSVIIIVGLFVNVLLIMFSGINIAAKIGTGSFGGIMGFMPILGLLIAFVILLFLGMLLWTYIYVRLYAASYLFLSGRTDIVNSVRESWGVTDGKVLRIFGLLTIIGVLMMGAVFSVGFAFGFGTALLGVVETMLYGGPFIALAIMTVFYAAMRMFSSFVGSYLGVGIYSMIGPVELPSETTLEKPVGVRRKARKRVS
ncbi:MAG: hypothetical protein ABIG39_03285 [Candidatus Micrarchaeota archaeon]